MEPRTPSDPAEAADLRADDPALRSAAPGSDDAAARRARAAIEARLFGGAAPEPAAAAPSPPPSPPTQVGRYVLEAKIGAGGMGVVYRAHDPELERHVAVKLLSADLSASGDDRARLRMIREARAMARLAHPNVIHVYDVGTVDDQVFVAMELVDGPSLARWLGGGARPWDQVLARFLAAGEGLAAAHHAGLIHRDFKPENVLVGADGRVRVLDFGLARTAGGGPGPSAGASAMHGEHGELGDDGEHGEHLEAEDAGEAGEFVVSEGAGGGARASTRPAALQASLTRTGALLGTPRYMSPEQCLGRQADARSDLFSFCVALYEGLYGRMPFRGDTVDTYLQSVAQGELQEPPPGEVPAWLWPVLRRGLAREPADRYATMEALLAALRGPPAIASARTRRLGWPSVLGGAALGAALLGWIVWIAVDDGRGRALIAPASSPALAVAPGVSTASRATTTTGETAAPAEASTTGDPTMIATATTTIATTGEAATSAGAIAATQPPATTAATKSPRRQDWCYMDEDRYLLLARMPRRRSHLKDDDGRCYVCRPESRPERVRRFQPADCGAYQVCGRAGAEACP